MEKVMRETVKIDRSVSVLQANLSDTARVSEWAELMGYNCPKRFARIFLRHYETRPQKILESVRIKSITTQLREGKWSNFEIARAHGIADEIALNKFVNYHLGCSPTALKRLRAIELEEVMQGVETWESNGG
jgi:methylphosphotriester-DNA--protein-cysteine methyltransferase